MNKNYDFSVIIPTHNRSAFLTKAIDSVLDQDASVQIIVVDDASTDDTSAVIADYLQKHGNIICIRNETSLFAHGARSRGYKEAHGKYIIFLDDDDFYIDCTFFKSAKDILDTYDNVSSVIGGTITYENGCFTSASLPGAEGMVSNKEYLNGFLQKYNKPSSTLTAVFRKSTLDRVGLHTSKMVDDTLIYLYGLVYGDVFLINEPVAAYRVHGTNISNRKFSFDFIFNTLNEKIKIYKLACSLEKLDNKTLWLYHQLFSSVIYFIKTSGYKLHYILAIFTWLLFNGQGTQFLWIQRMLRKLFGRK